MMSISKGDRLWRSSCFDSIKQKFCRGAQLAEKKFVALQHCVREEFVSEFFNNQENNSVHSSYKSLLCNYSEPHLDFAALHLVVFS